MEDSFLSSMDFPIRLSVFEGPMDLLLFLIRKQEIDIYDIPIEKVTSQYIETINAMEKLHLEVAGEFFVMAATLMEIKSRMLLPKHEQSIAEDEEGEEIDPRWELVHQLLEYKKFKEAAGDIHELIEREQWRMPREVFAQKKAERNQRPLKKSDEMEVWNAFNQVLRRLQDRLVSGEIEDEVVTVSDRMDFILDLTKGGERKSFHSLFPGTHTLAYVAYTFLAILELTRLKRLIITQDSTFGDIFFEVRPEGYDETDFIPEEELAFPGDDEVKEKQASSQELGLESEEEDEISEDEDDTLEDDVP